MIKHPNNQECQLVNKMTNYQLMDNPFSCVLIYKEDDEIIAFLDYSVIYEKIEINYIYVKEMYRSKGIAKQLLNALINEYKEKENITLEVSVDNDVAIHLYKKLGFKIMANRPNYYKNHDAYLMERRFYENISD